MRNDLNLWNTKIDQRLSYWALKRENAAQMQGKKKGTVGLNVDWSSGSDCTDNCTVLAVGLLGGRNRG